MDAAQTPLDIVHLRVTLVPAATPVTVVVGEAALAIEPDPLTMLQEPAPTAGVLAAMVNVEVLQRV